MVNEIEKLITYFFESKKYLEKTKLCELSAYHGSDKGTRHNYTTLYSLLFEHVRKHNLNIFEVGLGTNNINIPSNMGPLGKPGASLKIWRDYFNNSNIYGADVDRGCLFQEEKIKTFFVDQNKTETIQNLWSILREIEFDIIIDDGLHEFTANKNFFDNSIHKLKKGGIYILEDIDESYFEKSILWFENLKKNEVYSFVSLITIPINTDIQSNNRIGIIIK